MLKEDYQNRNKTLEVHIFNNSLSFGNTADSVMFLISSPSIKLSHGKVETTNRLAHFVRFLHIIINVIYSGHNHINSMPYAHINCYNLKNHINISKG